MYLTTLLTVGLLCGAGGSARIGQAQEKPLKVFVLVGQSNMQGHAHVRTLPHLGMDRATQPWLAEIMDDEGQPRIVDNVWISYLSSGGVRSGPLTAGFGADRNKMGPELAFGIQMKKRVAEPFLIIKAAWGGKSVHTDFRPPGAGPYEFDQAVLQRLADQGKDIEAVRRDKREATGVFYRQTIDHVNDVLADIGSVVPGYDEEQGYQLAGLVWFQGWNDMVDRGTYPQRGEPGGYDEYTRVLGQLIREFRQDLSAPDLPVVIGVMGVGGPTAEYGESQQRYRAVHQNFRDAMAAAADPAETGGNVVAVLTEEYWDPELDAVVSRDESLRSRLRKAKQEGRLKPLARQLNGDRQPTGPEEARLDQLEREGQLETVLLERLRTNEFSPRELAILTTGASNAAYHYLGSAKIMTGIGQGFAEALPLDESR